VRGDPPALASCAIGNPWRFVLVFALLAACGPQGGPESPVATRAVSPAADSTPAPLGVPTLAGGRSGQTAAPTVATEPASPGPAPECARLPAALRSLAAAADPAVEAERVGLPYRDGRVEVQAQLAAEAGDLAARHDLEVISSSRSFLVARVPVDRLCGLADDPRVRGLAPLRGATPAPEIAPTPGGA
jgi:hypothetical protein